MSESVDVAVIGAGPGGYVAAIRAAQLGLATAVIEREFVGGTCLNIGCIPSKALLDATHLLAQIRRASTFGIRTAGVEVDFAAMQAHKAKVVRMLTTGVRGLLRRHGVRLIEGSARFEGPHRLLIEPQEGAVERLEADNVIIATGSVEAELPGVPFDGGRIVSSRGALEFDAVPERLVVVGGGYIGLELGSVYARLGARVELGGLGRQEVRDDPDRAARTGCAELRQVRIVPAQDRETGPLDVLEMMDRLLPEMDRELAAAAAKFLGEQGLHLHLQTRVTGVEEGEGGDVVVLADGPDGPGRFSAERVLVSIGRRPATSELGLERVGIETDARGFIAVDHGMRTQVPGVYAIGDVVATPMLAHVAMDEGVVAAECIAGQSAAMEYDAVPAVVYTAPELASVGLREEDAELRGHRIKVGRFPFRGNGRARAKDEVEGWVKIIADADSDVILGVHCVGPEAGHLIHEAVVAMGYGGYAEDLALTSHAHPTLAEAFKEAALAVHGRPLHI